MKNKKILLMTNNFDFVSTLEPQGISILSSIAKEKGFYVELLEPAVKGLSYEQALEEVQRVAPDYLGISIIHNHNIEKAIHFITQYKKMNCNCTIFLGGFAVTQYYTDPHFSRLVSAADFFFRGESEISFSAFLDKISEGGSGLDIDGIGYWDGNNIIINNNAKAVEDLDSIPDQDRSILHEIIKSNPSIEEASVTVGRGCDRRCTFCLYAGMASKFNSYKYRHRYRSSSRIFEEIKSLYKMGIREFTLEDENLFEFETDFRKNISELYEMISGRLNDIRLISWTRIDSIDYELLRKFRLVGLKELYVGIDSFVDDDLRLFNKGYTSEEAISNLSRIIDEGFSLSLDSEFRIRLGYITWHPYTTVEGLEKTAKWLQYFGAPPKLIEHSLRVEPISPITKKIEHDGLLESKEFTKSITDHLWGFKDEKIKILYEVCMQYNKLWIKARDGIRLIEKYIISEKKAFDINLAEFKRLRIQLDGEYWCFFSELIKDADSYSAGQLLVLSQEIANVYIVRLNKIIEELRVKDIESKMQQHGLTENFILLQTTSAVSRYRKG